MAEFNEENELCSPVDRDLPVEENEEGPCEDYGETEFAYTDSVPAAELNDFQKETERAIAQKAAGLKISPAALGELAEIDLPSLEGGKLAALGLKRGELEFIRQSLRESLGQFWRDQDSGKLMAATAPSYAERVMDYVNQHKTATTLAALTADILANGSGVIADLAANSAVVEMGGARISLAELAQDPALMREIDLRQDMGTPADVLQEFNSREMFENESAGVIFNFNIDDKAAHKGAQRVIYFGYISAPAENIDKLDRDLQSIGISMVKETGKCSWDDFVKNREQIIFFIAQDLQLPEADVRGFVDAYEDRYNHPEADDISIVELKDFKIYSESQPQTDALRIQHKFAETYKKYEVYDAAGNLNRTNKEKADEELIRWARENGYHNFAQAYLKEKVAYEKKPTTRLQHLVYTDVWAENQPNDDKFRELFWQKMEEKYTMAELQKIEEENPEQLLTIVAEVVADNVEYDQREHYYKRFLEFLGKLPAGEKLQEAAKPGLKNYSDEGMAYTALESGEAQCDRFSVTYMAGMAVLKDKLREADGGTCKLDNVQCCLVTSHVDKHAFVAVFSLDENGQLEGTYIDPTWYKDLGELNAVNADHSFTRVEEMQKALPDQLARWNNFVAQERLRQVLQAYSPRRYKTRGGVELNAAAWAEYQKQKKNAAIPNETAPAKPETDRENEEKRKAALEEGSQEGASTAIDERSERKEKLMRVIREKIFGKKEAE